MYIYTYIYIYTKEYKHLNLSHDYFIDNGIFKYVCTSKRNSLSSGSCFGPIMCIKCLSWRERGLISI